MSTYCIINKKHIYFYVLTNIYENFIYVMKYIYIYVYTGSAINKETSKLEILVTPIENHG